MKKFTLLILAAFFAAVGWAQPQTVTIGAGTSTSTALLGGLWGHGRYAVLYTADELGIGDIQSADILKIAFQLGTVTAPTANRDLKIYIKEVSDDVLATSMFSSGWNALVATATLIYDKQGTSISLTASAWNDFIFPSSFSYNGGNLLILTDSKGNTSSGNASTNTYYHTSTNRSWSATVDGTLADNAAGSVSNTRANIMITLDNIVLANCQKPTLLATSNVLARSVDINFTSTAGTYQYVIGVSSITDPSTLTPVSFTTKPYTITGLTPSTAYRVWVRNDCGGGDYSYWTAYASFTTSESCFPPTGVTIPSTTVTANTAIVNWTASTHGETDWVVEYKTSAQAWTDAGIGSQNASGTPTATLSGLTHNTIYNVRVKSDCGTFDGFSTYTTAVNCTTTCAAYALPFIENFASSSIFTAPTCWSRYALSASSLFGGTTFSTTSTNWGHTTTSSGLNGNHVRINLYNTNRNDWVLTPQINIGTTPSRLSFDLALTTYNGTNAPILNSAGQRFIVAISADGGTTWNQSDAYIWDNTGSPRVYSTIATTGENVVIDLSAYSGIIKIGFYGESTSITPTPTPSIDNYLHVGNIVVEAIPSCEKPTGLATSNFAAKSVDINFTSTESAYQYVVGASSVTDPTTLTPVSFTTKPYTITGLMPSTAYRVWVRNDCGGGDYSDWTAYASFTTTVACTPPTGVTIPTATVTATSAIVNWTPSINGETDWVVEYKTLAQAWTDVGIGSQNASVNPTTTLTGLTPNTIYNVRIKSDCDTDGFSTYTTAVNCTTACAAYTLPFMENFASSSIFTEPTCWKRYSLLASSLFSGTPFSTTSASWLHTTSSSGLTGNHVRINVYTAGSTDKKEWMLTPQINIGTTPSRLVFDVALTGYSASDPLPAANLTGTDDKFIVAISADGGTTWSQTNAYIWDNAGSTRVFNDLATKQTVYIDLSAYTGIIQIGFYAESTVANADNYLHIGNVVVEAIPNCDKPTALAASNHTTGGATISWTAGASAETAWVLEYKKASEADTQYVPVNVTTTPQYVLSGLAHSTAYNVRVKAVCGPGSESEFTTAITVNTLPANDICANAIALPCGTTGLAGTTVGATEKTITGNTASKYGVFYTFAGDGQETVITSVAATGYNHSISIFTGDCTDLTWVRKVDVSTGTTETYTFNTEVGTTYYLYIAHTTSTSTATGTFTISRTCACPPPTGVAVITSSIRTTTASIEFTPNSTTANYEYVVTPSTEVEANLGTYTPVAVTASPINLTGLSATTSYKVWVRGVCAVGDYSRWIATANFTTLGTTVPVPYAQDFSNPAPEFTFRQTSATGNRFVVGSATGNPAPGLFISNDGTAYGYNVTGSIYATAEVLIDFGNFYSYTLSFDWKGLGERIGTSDYDYGNVYLVDATSTSYATTTEPTTGKLNTTRFVDQANWQNFSIELDGAAYANTVKKLVFYWRQDASGGTSASPIAIDNISFVGNAPPACIPPTLTSTGIVPTPDGAVVTLATTGDATAWQYVVSTVATADPDALTPVDAGTNPFTVVGLNPNTVYYIWVRGVCNASDISTWTARNTFRTLCPTSYPLPFSDDFSGWTASSSWYNPCWSRYTGTGVYDSNIRPYVSTTIGSNNALYFYQSSSTINAAFLPLLDADGLTLQVEFDLQMIASNRMDIVTTTDPQSAPATWTVHATISDGAGTGNLSNYKHYEVVIPNYQADTYIGFKSHTGNTTAAYLDNVVVNVAPPCPKPTITATSTESNNAMVTVNVGTAWQYVISTSATADPNDLTPVSVNTSPFTISGLNDNTQYYIWVRSNCGVDGVSDWRQGTFRTKCNALSLPLTEGFEGTEFPPACWKTEHVSGAVSWERYTTSTPIGTASASVNFDTGASSTNPANNWLITPKIDATTATNLKLSFWVKCASYYANTTLNVKVSTATDAITDFSSTALLTLSNAQITTTWVQKTVDLSAYAGQRIYIGFQVLDANGLRIMLDDIYVREVFANDVGATSITSSVGTEVINGTTANFTVAVKNLGTAAQTDVPVKLEVDGAVVATEVIASIASDATTNVTFTGINISTPVTHTFAIRAYTDLATDQVRANDTTAMLYLINGNPCDVGVKVGTGTGTSSATPIMNYDFNYSQTIYLASELIAAGGGAGEITNIAYQYVSGALGATNNVWTVYMGHTAKTDFTSNTDWIALANLEEVYSGIVTTPAMSIELDNPFVWDGTSNIVVAVLENLPGYATPPTVNTTTGTNRSIYFRIDATNPGGAPVNPASPPTASGRNSFYANMKFNICPPATCFKPVVALDGTTETSATISWTGGNASSYKVEWGVAGFTQGTGTTQTVAASPYTIQGLNANTAYNVYVKGDCGGGDISKAGKLSFRTDCQSTAIAVTPTSPFFEGFENGISPCWANIDADGDGFMWEIGTSPGVPAHSGTKCATSVSFDNDSGDELTPDNYLVTPKLALPAGRVAELKYWVAAQDPLYPADHYSVKISTTDLDPASFTEVFGETLSTNVWAARTVNLGAYAGQEIYIAFVHNECTDQYMMKIDDVEVYIVPIAPVANFTYAANKLIVTFTDTSIGEPTAWDWNFGNGESSTDQNPVYTYAAAGTYNVTLVVTNAIGESAPVTKQITVTDVGIPNVFAGNITIYPNPAKEMTILEIDGLNTAAQVVITDLTGRTIASYNFAATQTKLEINVGGYADGTYLVRIISDKVVTVNKLVVKK